VLSDHNEKPILLQVKSNKILISTAGRNQEEAEESLSTEYNGKDVEIAFKSNYLQDIFSTIESEECFFNLFGPDKNCLVTSPEDPNFKCILMPLLM
jgi:DNA polymerase III sliding clamp (beta) subunit (PCNA family)